MLLPRLLLLLSIALRCTVASGTAYSAAAFGQGIDVWSNFPPSSHDKKKFSLPTGGQISWACEVEGIGLGLCDAENSEFHLWRTTTADEGEGGSFLNVSLAPLGNPVGAFQSAVDGRIYIACFGTHPVPRNDSGVAVVDVSDAGRPRLVETYVYSHPHHVHNVYEFDLGPSGNGSNGGRPEVFLAVTGNPWMDPPVPGHGLVMLDREAGTFVEMTTGAALNVRSAKQLSPGVFYALTQEPEGVQSRLVRLEARTNEVSGKGELVVRADTLLPPREGGDGGADVVLGLEPDTVWASDRWAGPGRLYYYSFDSSLDAPTGFVLRATHVATGVNARYTVIANSGDMMVCSEDSRTLTLLHGLALFPTEISTKTTVETVGTVQFFMESDMIPLGEGTSNARIKFKAGPKLFACVTLGLLVLILPFRRALRRTQYSQLLLKSL